YCLREAIALPPNLFRACRNLALKSPKSSPIAQSTLRKSAPPAGKQLLIPTPFFFSAPPLSIPSRACKNLPNSSLSETASSLAPLVPSHPSPCVTRKCAVIFKPHSQPWKKSSPG